MKMTKKAVSYILVFLMVFSSFTILPSEFFNWGNVSAVDVTTEETPTVETNEKEIAVEANKDEAMRLVKTLTDKYPIY